MVCQTDTSDTPGKRKVSVSKEHRTGDSRSANGYLQLKHYSLWLPLHHERDPAITGEDCTYRSTLTEDSIFSALNIFSKITRIFII